MKITAIAILALLSTQAPASCWQQCPYDDVLCLDFSNAAALDGVIVSPVAGFSVDALGATAHPITGGMSGDVTADTYTVTLGVPIPGVTVLNTYASFAGPEYNGTWQDDAGNAGDWMSCGLYSALTCPTCP